MAQTITVRWLPEALADIERLHLFLNDRNAGAATRAAIVILQGARLLKTMPRIGRPMSDETGRRELFLPFGTGAYVIRYMQESDDIVIVIRVWHSREDRLTEN